MLKHVYLIPLSIVISVLFINSVKAQSVEVETAFSEMFERPLGIEYSHEGSSLIYIVGMNGKVFVKDTQAPDSPSTLFIDISDRVAAYRELGLLGIAFSPDFQTDDTFYLYYAYEDGGQHYSTLARYKASDGVGNRDSEEVLFELFQPRDNHNGGQMAFGPDGYLYIAIGDGGSDSNFLAQDTAVLNGSILRIDVSPETGYAIPPDNPFVGNPNGRDEIFAWGFRNPWRMSFDYETGNLWIADVGHQYRETIYIVDKGKNYGWPIIEGTVCYPIGTTDCDKTGLEMPVFEYPYDQEWTGRSITGGYVYRGTHNPSLYGKYIYGDFVSRRIWALEIDHSTREVIANTEIASSFQNLPTFGVDSFGEIYISGWGGGVDSKIFRFTPELTLTTAALKSIDGSSGIQLTWDVNKDSGIGSFEIYKGATVSDMNLLTTVPGTDLGFIDPDPLDGSTFYTVRAIETDGTGGEMSEPVSYYRTASTISDGWQMISIPYESDGVSIANSLTYSFNGSYSVADQLLPGMGYWIRSTAVGGSEYTAEGIGVQNSTIMLNQGWNLVGGIIGEVRNEFIVDRAGILNSTPMYSFNGSTYQESGSFLPGQGYWLYADEAGAITLDLGAPVVSATLNNVVSKPASAPNNSEWFDKFDFESGGVTAELLVSETGVSPDLRDRYRVPPVAPNAELDIRTTDGFRLAEGNLVEPDLTVKEFPVSVRFTSAGNGVGNQMPGSFGQVSDVVYKVTLYRNGEPESIELLVGESVLIADPYDRMELERSEIDSDIVQQTELLPSYPNPFNPVTNISYRLSEQQQVTLTVFDAAGRRIATLVDREQGAGQYNLPFDASGLASGIYFVRFSAGDVLSTQKLTLIK